MQKASTVLGDLEQGIQFSLDEYRREAERLKSLLSDKNPTAGDQQARAISVQRLRLRSADKRYRSAREKYLREAIAGFH